MARPKDVEPPRATRNITQKDLRALLQQCDAFQKKVDNASGHLSDVINEAVSKKGLHRGAWRMARRWARMEDAALREELDALDDYRAKLGIDKVSKSMFPAGDEDEFEESEKVSRMPRRVNETAGEAAE